MATSITNDSRCATCGKAAGTFTCRGCAKDFCLRHTNEHRQELSKQMDEDIIPLHDQLRQNFDEQTNKTNDQPLIKQIDQRERDSLEKIRQAANDARKQFLNVMNKHTVKIKETLESLTQQLKKARDDDHFFETDLKEWMKKLEELKKDFITPQMINVRLDDNDTSSFISKLVIIETANISDERFEQSLGNIKISDDGAVATHNQTSNHASVRGRREYSSGEHRLRFVIENLSAHKWIFLGIISKSASTQSTSVICKSGYGFSGGNNVWCDGAGTTGLNGYKSEFEIHDTIELLINCDQRTICLINERTRSSYTIDVNIVKCPFPWKLSVGFYYFSGERIRLLS